MSTSARLLRLLSLLQTPRDWTGAELAARLEVSARTIRNDIERLRVLGYPVHATRGSVGGYRLEAGTSMPPRCSTTTRRSRSRSACARPPRAL
jgi:predicted DNA-binding transcriptional regulator YafY